MSLNLDSELIWKSLIYYAEEMKITLRNAAFSPNIRERMDHSSAIFDVNRKLIAQSKAIPVHLGSMVVTLEKVLDHVETIEKKDTITVNDPYTGGTHLPDITLISPVFYEGKPVVYLVNRAHHSDVGGKAPGSFAGDSKEIFEEGIRIPPVKLQQNGTLQEDILDLILKNTRTPTMRRGDIFAQIAANNTGRKRVKKLLDKFGQTRFQTATKEIRQYCNKRMKKKLRKYPPGTYESTDYLEGCNSQPLPITVEITLGSDNIHFDFSDSAKEVKAPLNAPYGVSLAAVLFVVKAIFDPTAPSNHGTYQPVELTVKEGTILNATPPAPVVGGNVETSQRIVDTLLQAIAEFAPKRVCAGAQGTMNNIAIGGSNNGKSFTFYETIGGGFGGRHGKDGPDGIHSHMTNTMNTPIEEIERRYPLLVTEYTLREDSCGAGKWRGGLGIQRNIKALTSARVSLLGERHNFAPYGLFGGKKGTTGEYRLRKHTGEEKVLNSKERVTVAPKDTLVIHTPGGGGYGDPKEREIKKIKADLRNQRISQEKAKKEYNMRE